MKHPVYFKIKASHRVMGPIFALHSLAISSTFNSVLPRNSEGLPNYCLTSAPIGAWKYNFPTFWKIRQTYGPNNRPNIREPGLRIRIRCFCMDPDHVFKFLWIRIRFSNFSGSGSVFQISLDPDPVSAQMEQKKIAERSLKVIYQKKT